MNKKRIHIGAIISMTVLFSLSVTFIFGALLNITTMQIRLKEADFVLFEILGEQQELLIFSKIYSWSDLDLKEEYMKWENETLISANETLNQMGEDIDEELEDFNKNVIASFCLSIVGLFFSLVAILTIERENNKIKEKYNLPTTLF